MNHLAAAGACVEPVRAPVTGGGAPPDLAEARAVALLPEGWPTGKHLVEVAVEEDITLPLVLLWSVGIPVAAVERIGAGMARRG